MGRGGGVRVDMNEECGCERRSFVKIKKKKKLFCWGVWSGGGGGQGRCERRSEVFVKIQRKKKIFWGVGGVGFLGGEGVRVELNEVVL